MSSANLELVRSIYAEWERGDHSGVDWADPEIEYVMVGGPDPGAWQGLQGMADAFREVLRAWTDWRVSADDYVDLDGDRVLVPFHFTGRGRTSGLEAGRLRSQGVTLFHVRAGRITRIVQYFDFDRNLALAELGLPPTDDAAD